MTNSERKRRRTTKKDRQDNDKQWKEEMTNSELQNTTQKAKDRATRNTLCRHTHSKVSRPIVLNTNEKISKSEK
jgi:hypothetical protein